MGIIFLYPFMELLSLIYLGREIGFGSMMIYLVGTFFVGINLIRSAGFNSVKMSSPTVVLEAPFRLMAGFLILIPGLVSDVLAILILVPFVRKVLWLFFIKKVSRGRVFQQSWQASSEDIIDVNYVREERDVTASSRETNMKSLT